MRILIVEDDASVSEVLQMLCEELGHEHRTAATVPIAATLWREWEADCVLLDLKLPGDPGIVFVRHVRLMGDETPIIVISGNLEPQWLTELEQFGVTAIVPKPFDPERVAQLLRSLSPAEC